MRLIIIKYIFQFSFKLIEFFRPKRAVNWAINLFFTPRRFKRPHREQGFQEQASLQRMPFEIGKFEEIYKLSSFSMDRKIPLTKFDPIGKNYYALYTLGEGPTILLVHGWSGRASRMGTIAKIFVEHGYKVLTFDAFAHGESPGYQTSGLEFAAIIKDIYENYGPFQAIVGHSLGGMAAGLAIKNGVVAEKLITIGTPTNMQFVLDSFGEILNASDRTVNGIKNFVEELVGQSADIFSLTNIAKDFRIDGLIVHDKNDKEAPVKHAYALKDVWDRSELLITEKLGHTRILRDETTLKQIFYFITATEKIAAS